MNKLKALEAKLDKILGDCIITYNKKQSLGLVESRSMGDRYYEKVTIDQLIYQIELEIFQYEVEHKSY